MSDDRSSKDDAGEDWGADWESHRRRQLTFALAATPADRLRWLEEMIALAHRTGALPRPRAAVTAKEEAEPLERGQPVDQDGHGRR